jgi:hypothetical protein
VPRPATGAAAPRNPLVPLTSWWPIRRSRSAEKPPVPSLADTPQLRPSADQWSEREQSGNDEERTGVQRRMRDSKSSRDGTRGVLAAQGVYVYKRAERFVTTRQPSAARPIGMGLDSRFSPIVGQVRGRLPSEHCGSGGVRPSRPRRGSRRPEARVGRRTGARAGEGARR